MTYKLDQFEDRTTPQVHHFQDAIKIPAYEMERIKTELKHRGASDYDMFLPETRYLPRLIHEDEHIMGSVFGHYDQGVNKRGRGALIATNQRVLFIDKKPLYFHCDELTFMIIGGVTYTKSPIFAYVTLHSRLGDYKLRTFNVKNAANFVDYIEAKCLQNTEYGTEKFEHVT